MPQPLQAFSLNLAPRFYPGENLLFFFFCRFLLSCVLLDSVCSLVVLTFLQLLSSCGSFGTCWLHSSSSFSDSSSSLSCSLFSFQRAVCTFTQPTMRLRNSMRLLVVSIALSALLGHAYAQGDDSEVHVDEVVDDAGPETDDKVPEEIVYSTLQLDEESSPFLYEHFDDDALFKSRWVKSRATKSDSQDLKYDGDWELTESHSRLKGTLYCSPRKLLI